MNPHPIYTNEQLTKIKSIIRVAVDDIIKRATQATNTRLIMDRLSGLMALPSELEKVPEKLSLFFIFNRTIITHQATIEEINKILSKIQEETDLQLVATDPIFKRFMRIALSERNPDNQWLDHHPIKRPGEKLSLAFRNVQLNDDETQVEAGQERARFGILNHDCTRLVWRCMDTTERSTLGMSRATRAPVYSMFRQDIHSSFRQNQIVYAVPNKSIHVGKWTHSWGPLVHNNPFYDRRIALPVSFSMLAQYCQELQEPEDGFLIFSSKADAQAYTRRHCVWERHKIIEVPPILSIANVGQPLRFEPDAEGLLCTRMPRKTGFVLGIEVYEPSAGKIPYVLKNCLMMRTPFDAPRVKPLIQNALVEVPVIDTRWKTIRNRDAAHLAFMDTIPHRPLTVNDLRRWLKEFYCEHYLANKKNGAMKMHDLQELLLALDEAEALGAEYGSNLWKFLSCKPFGDQPLSYFLKSHRGNSRHDSWGWTTVLNTFLKPNSVILTRSNRDQFHRDFMKTIKNQVPTLNDFLRWLTVFYCKHYLPSQKQGEAKQRAILAILKNILVPKNVDSDAKPLSIAEFLDQNPELQKQIQSKRMGISKKVCWGWQQIEESFLEPEGLAKGSQRIPG